MIITKNKIVNDSGEFESYSSDHFDFYWKGFIYVSKTQNAKKSIIEFNDLLNRSSIENSVSALKGHFFIIIFDKRRGKYYALVDNNGLYKAFYSSKSISSSVLRLANFEKLTKEDIDSQAVVELMHFGTCIFQNTPFAQIKRIGADEIVSFSEDGETTLIRKTLPAITVKPEIDFIDFFRGLAEVSRNERISCDLTGGTDSRMIVTLLDYLGIDFECSISGLTGDADIEIAKEVARQLNLDLHITYHKPEVDIETLHKLFVSVDGNYNLLDFHRLNQLQNDRKKRGVTLALSGVGGELFKDFWWLQDFPFYAKRRSNIERLYSWRIAPIMFPSQYFTEHFYAISKELNQTVVHRLDKFVLDSNTRTYDNIYLKFRMPETFGNVVTSASHYIKFYAPLVEYDLARYAFHLPRRIRLFNRFHRGIITELNPRVARLKTTSGTTVSSEKRKMAMDAYWVFSDQLKRALNKGRQKYLPHTTSGQSVPDHPALYSKLYEMDFINELLEILKDEAIVARELKLQNIDRRYLGNFITLGMLFGR